MQIPFLNKNKKIDWYLGLFLKEDQGVAIIISTKSEKTEIIDFEKFNYSNSWENITEDIDEVLYRLESKQKIRLEETIFFVYSHLIDEKTNQIKKHYQQKIKNIAKDLELKPLGFIDCKEAVLKILEQKDENKLTGIVAELDKDNLSVFVYKAGQLVFARSVVRTNNLVEDLNLIFEETKGKILLPTRIILYNSKDLDYEVTKIVSFHWSSDLFIQLPRVEIIQERDILQDLVSLFKQQIKVVQVDEIEEKEETAGFIIGHDVKNSNVQEVPQKKEMSFPNLNSIFAKIHLPKINISFIRPEMQKRIFIILGVFIILSGFFINEYFLHKVKLEIYVPSENLKKTLTLLVGEKNDVDLKIKSIKKDWEISTSTQATGKKNIGDAATGEVTLYNYNKETTFSKGTKVTSNGLSFTLDNEVKVASASLTTDGSAKLPGKAKGKVTAVEIGTSSNLTKGQTFKIDDLDGDIYFAKNESDFNGGTQKQITTVSEKDIEKLENDIENKAKQEKATSFNLKSDEKIINQLTTTEITKKNYSKDVGEEATSITLTATIQTVIYSYEKTELINFIFNKLKVELKPNYNLDKTRISYQIKDVEENKKGISLEILAEAKAIKTIDKNQAIKKLLGKPEGSIEDILKRDYDISGYQNIQKQPLAIPFYKNLLPFFYKNFEVEIGSL